MARTGRKQLTVLITEDSFARLEEIKQETGLSNAKLVEMLLENYNGTSINTNINTGITEEQLRKILKEELSCININTSIDTKEESININTNTKPKKQKKKPEPVLVPDEVEDEDDLSMGGLFHVLPKTAKVGKKETQMKQYHEGPISWMVLEGCRAHFDKNGKPIPFRITGEDGSVWEPDLDEINEISRVYGKPVETEV